MPGFPGSPGLPGLPGLQGFPGSSMKGDQGLPGKRTTTHMHKDTYTIHIIHAHTHLYHLNTPFSDTHTYAHIHSYTHTCIYTHHFQSYLGQGIDQFMKKGKHCHFSHFVMQHIHSYLSNTYMHHSHTCTHSHIHLHIFSVWSKG